MNIDSIAAPYGYCPICGEKGRSRERRLNGDDMCYNGHNYPSIAALQSKPERTGIPLNLSGVIGSTVKSNSKVNAEIKLTYPDRFKATCSGEISSKKATDIYKLFFNLEKGDSDYSKLYKAVNDLVCKLGADGQVHTETKEVMDLMDVLHEIDGGEFKENIDGSDRTKTNKNSTGNAKES